MIYIGKNTPRFLDAFEKTRNIIESKFPHYDFSESVYLDTVTNMSCKCKIHGTEIVALIRDYERKTNDFCEECKDDSIMNNHIKKSKEKFGDTFDYSKAKWTGCDNYMEFICVKHGSIKQQITTHMQVGCSQCNAEKRYSDKIGEYKLKLFERYGDRYELIGLDRAHNNRHEKMILKCHRHGEFKSEPHAIFNSIQGCNKCAYESRSYEYEGYVERFNKKT